MEAEVILNTRKLDIGYGSTCIAKNLMLSLYAGEMVCLIGPNGCGKSTLLSIIAGLLSPEEGTILVNNPDGLLHYPKIGYMLQKDHLFEWRTIYQNITLGLEINQKLTKERLEHVDQLLKDYDLLSFKDKKPSELSGGMKQRAALIRTLALDPDILLLDEPTNDLDISTLNVLEQYLKNFRGCLIVISHDRYFMDKVVDHLFVFHGEGNIQDFPGNYTQYREATKQKAKSDESKSNSQSPINNQKVKTEQKRRLSYKEKKELEELEIRIPQLEEEKTQLDNLLRNDVIL